MIREPVWSLRLDKKGICLMGIGILLNFLCFLMTKNLRMPLWLDTTGTIYISMTLGPIAGLIVGLVNNIVLVFFIGANSLFYFLVSGYVAIVVGVCVKSGLVQGILAHMGLAFAVYVGSVFLCVLIAMMLNHGQPNDYYGALLYSAGKEAGFGNMASSIISNTVIKLLDTCVSFALALAACLFTPKKRRRYQY